MNNVQSGYWQFASDILNGSDDMAKATTPPASDVPAAAVVTDKLGLKYKVTKQVTLEAIKMPVGEQIAVTITAAAYQGKEVKGKPGEAAKAAATLIPATNLETGEIGVLVANKVLHSTLTEEYPNDGYVGRSFLILKKEKASGRAYNAFDVKEITLEA